MTDPFNVVFLIFALVAAGIAGWGLYLVVRGVLDLRRSSGLKRDGQQTTGTVVDNQVESHYRSGTTGGPYRASFSWLTFQPAVRFRTLDGRDIVAVGPARSRRSFVSGTTVSVLYDPGDPTKIQLLSGHGRGSGGAARLASGLFAIVGAAAFLTFVLVMHSRIPGA